MDYLVTEAVVEKAAIERAEAQKEANDRSERRSWTKDHKELATPLGVG